METEINRLLTQYENKINTCDKIIHDLEETKRAARIQSLPENSKRIRAELQVVYAQRQAYVQAKVDIDSLLDNLETYNG